MNDERCWKKWIDWWVSYHKLNLIEIYLRNFTFEQVTGRKLVFRSTTMPDSSVRLYCPYRYCCCWKQCPPSDQDGLLFRSLLEKLESKSTPPPLGMGRTGYRFGAGWTLEYVFGLARRWVRNMTGERCSPTFYAFVSQATAKLPSPTGTAVWF